MKYQLVYVDEASKDLNNIVAYIASDSEERANKYYDKITKMLDSLEGEPYIGRPHSDEKYRKLGWRELVVDSHIAHYKVNEEKKCVNILRVLHAAMNQVKHLKGTKY